MGGAETFGSAFAKAQMAAGQHLPESGTAFISVNNLDKPNVLPVARQLAGLGFKLVATRGTAAYLRAHGLEADIIFKVNEGRPHVGDELLNRRIALVINTPLGRESFFDDRTVRSAAMLQGVPCITTLTGAAAAVSAIAALRTEGLAVQVTAGISPGADQDLSIAGSEVTGPVTRRNRARPGTYRRRRNPGPATPLH